MSVAHRFEESGRLIQQIEGEAGVLNLKSLTQFRRHRELDFRSLLKNSILGGAALQVLAEKLFFICGQRPSAAEGVLILLNLAARLEATPFQNGLQTAFFRKLFKRCDKK